MLSAAMRMKQCASVSFLCRFVFTPLQGGGELLWEPLVALETFQLESGRWMTPEVRDAFVQSYVLFRASHNLLATAALLKQQLRYRYRPKLHQLGHITYHWVAAKSCNPRHMSCYLDEDFVNKTKRLAMKASPRYVSQQVGMRYNTYLCLLFSGLLSR